jgi:hypothetical protein
LLAQYLEQSAGTLSVIGFICAMAVKAAESNPIKGESCTLTEENAKL